MYASLVKVDEKGEILETLEMFVWTPFKIQWSIGHQIRIEHKKKVMTKEGKVVDDVDQKICIQKLEQFATNAKYVVCSRQGVSSQGQHHKNHPLLTLARST